MNWTLMLLALGASGTEAPTRPARAPQVQEAAKAKDSKAPEPKKPESQARESKPPAAWALELEEPKPSTVSDLLGLDEDTPPVNLLDIPPGIEVPPVYRQPFVWDVPKVVDIVDVPGVMLADGVPVRLKAVRSKEKPEPLLQHIVDRWEAWGLFIPPVEHQPQTLREAQITALDPERLITYTVIFQPNPDGTTTLYLGEANMSQPPQAVSSVAPVFAGAEGVMTSELEVVRSVNYTVRAKEAEVEAFYRAELGKAGFKEVEPRRFRSGHEEMELVIRSVQPGQLSVAVLRRTVAPEAGKPTVD
ncbi:hypothetical protein [Myxococcus sp. RHSTA-1-4]|uniref:hypothetical protein n=1 Tax=Myxococcus sp. RHSTA-1-4 TaxID=2874601 RepID=UPI001CBD2FB7|nr:hypothetical protein [Myxococcus sp. RHSTA-1-4]MBZ4419658.1 hypothetical protein [Myxococcus sp. RHSTA-1-4]